jgi:XTP/dITP diphosphohydrolase
MPKRPVIFFATKSDFKIEEFQIIRAAGELCNGKCIDDLFDVQISKISPSETLEVDIEKIVKQEVVDVYRVLKAPCLVEHAGLILDGKHGFPGGLTKPIWNSLNCEFWAQFIDKPATALSWIAFCDGRRVLTFNGITKGHIAPPSAGRDFYWDNIFCPDGQDGCAKTYAEIASSEDGLRKKVRFSQFTKSILSCFNILAQETRNVFFDYWLT